MDVNIEKGSSLRRGIFKTGWFLGLIGLAASLLAVFGVTKVSAEVATGYSLKVTQVDASSMSAEIRSSDNALYTAASVQYAYKIGSGISCLNDNTYTSGTTRVTNSTGRVTISFTSSQAGHTVCVKATKANDSTKFDRAGETIDLTVPVISLVSQTATAITVKATDANLEKSNDAVANNFSFKAKETTCNNSTTGFTDSASSVTASGTNGVQLVENISTIGAKDGDVICFKFTDKFSNAGYKTIAYNLAKPVLEKPFQAGVGSASSLEVRAKTAVKWYSKSLTTGSETSCGDKPGNIIDGSSTTRRLVISSVNTDNSICVWAEDPSTAATTSALYILANGINTEANLGTTYQVGKTVILGMPTIRKSTPNSGFTSETNVVDLATGDSRQNLTAKYRLVTNKTASDNRATPENCDADTAGLFSSGYTQSTHPNSIVGDRKTVSGNTVELGRPSSYDAICLQYKNGFNQIDYEWKDLVAVSSTGPVFTVDQRVNYGKSVTVTVSGLPSDTEIRDWYRGDFGDSSTAACANIDNAGNRISEGVSSDKTKVAIEIPPNDINKWSCIRLLTRKSGADSHDYLRVYTGATAVDVTKPVISIEQTNNKMTATATDSQSGVKTSSWRHVVVASGDSAKCDEDHDDVSKLAWKDGSEATVTAKDSQDGKRVCFNVEDNAGNSTYEHVGIDTISDGQAPTISAVQNRDKLTYTTEDNLDTTFEDSQYKYIEYAADATKPANCAAAVWSATGVTVMTGKVKGLTEADDGKHYCLQVADKAGNIGYSEAPITVDTIRPSIILSQSEGVLTATATSAATGWKYYQSPTEVACTEADSQWQSSKDVNSGSTITLTNEDVGTYICFQVSDAVGNIGLKKHLVSELATADDADDDATTDDDDNTADDGDDTTTDDGTTADDGDDTTTVDDDTTTPDDGTATDEPVTVVTTVDGNDRVTANLSSGTITSARSQRYNSVTAANNQCQPGGDIDRNDASFAARNSITSAGAGALCFRVTADDGQTYYAVHVVGGQVGDTTQTTTPATTPATGETPPTTTTPSGDDATTDDEETPTTTTTPSGDDATTTGDEETPTTTTTTDDSETTTDEDDGDEEGFISKYLIWIIIGAAVVVLGLVFLVVTISGNREQ